MKKKKEKNEKTGPRHNREDRHVRLFQKLLRLPQVIATVVVAAIRDNDHGAALVLRLALRRTYAPIDPIKKRGFPLGAGQKQLETPAKGLLIARQVYNTFRSRIDA